MHKHHKRAYIAGAAAVIIDIACGVAWSRITPGLPAWHGLYCSLADAVTRGGDCPLRTGGQYALSAIECFTVVPLFAATYSFITSGLTSAQTAEQTEASEGRIKRHFEARLKHHADRCLQTPDLTPEKVPDQPQDV